MEGTRATLLAESSEAFTREGKDGTMLVLTRKPQERLFIGPDIEIVIVDVRGDQVRLGIVAPPHVNVQRDDAKKKVPPESGRKMS
jgi:carbon storage regulator